MHTVWNETRAFFYFFILQLSPPMEMLAHVTEVKLFHHPFYGLKFSPEKDTVRKKK